MRVCKRGGVAPGKEGSGKEAEVEGRKSGFAFEGQISEFLYVFPKLFRKSPISGVRNLKPSPTFRLLCTEVALLVCDSGGPVQQALFI